MVTSPQFVALLVGLSAVLISVHLAVAPEPFAASSATVIALGVIMFAIITTVGLVFVRGRWARFLGIAVATLTLVVAATAEQVDGWAIGAILTGLAALGGLTGRWLDGWIRDRPSATGPDPKAVLLLLGLLGLVPAVGLVAPGGLETAHGVLGAAGVLLAWGYGSAQLWALWASRLVLPVLVVFGAIASAWPGTVALIVYGGGLVWLAWSEEVQLAVQPLMDDLPGPRPLRHEKREPPP